MRRPGGEGGGGGRGQCGTAGLTGESVWNNRVEKDGKSLSLSLHKSPVGGSINNQRDSLGFTLDGILHNASQETVFSSCAQDVVSGVLEGLNGTIFTYGQTGAGKTFTICGDVHSYQQRGIVPRALHQLFTDIESRLDMEVSVKVSYLEIYNEVMYDLLADDPGSSGSLTVVENKNVTDVKGLEKREIGNEQEALALFFAGETMRSTAEHFLNKESSRSHCVFTVYVEARSGGDASDLVTASKLHFVDLAGSERTKKSAATGQAMKEAMFINKSLSFLEQTVNALSKKVHHVPFRQSKLTSVLKDALGGNCKTVMVGCVWGEDRHMEETLSTLRFASRVRTIETHPVVNESKDPSVLVRRYERQIADLKQELMMRDTFTGRGRISYDEYSDAERKEIKDSVQSFLEGKIAVADMRIDSLRQVKETFVQFKAAFDALSLQAPAPAMEAGGTAGEEPSSRVEEDGDVPGGVGEADTAEAGFSVGKAPSLSRPVATPTRGKLRENVVKATPVGSHPVSREGGGSPAERSPQARAPSRNAAYDQFKKTTVEGRTLSGTLRQEQFTLQEKRQALRDLATGMNSDKADIDRLTELLKAKREAHKEGSDVTDDEEYQLARELKEKKLSYRQAFGQVKIIRQDMEQHKLSTQTAKENLIAAFQDWDRNDDFEDGGPGLDDDPEEEFENLAQRHMMQDPEAMAFHVARKTTLHRRAQAPLAQYQGEKGRGSMARKKERETLRNFGQRA